MHLGHPDAHYKHSPSFAHDSSTDRFADNTKISCYLSACVRAHGYAIMVNGC